MKGDAIYRENGAVTYPREGQRDDLGPADAELPIHTQDTTEVSVNHQLKF